MSKHRLSSVEKQALSKGLKFSLYPSKLNFVQHFLSFEKLYKSLSNLKLFDPLRIGVNYVNTTLRHSAFDSFYSHNPFNNKYNLHKDELTALKNLSSDPDIVITKPDKGNGVVLMDKSSYVSKLNTIISDVSKFTKLSGDMFGFILKFEDRINRLLRALKSKGVIPDSVYSQLFVSGSQPGIMYGLPKVHKTDCPLRPILFSNWHTLLQIIQIPGSHSLPHNTQ